MSCEVCLQKISIYFHQVVCSCPPCTLGRCWHSRRCCNRHLQNHMLCAYNWPSISSSHAAHNFHSQASGCHLWN
ncbi:hypothetical protein DUNSADRAFT_15760 [Dunaliella salina]|uniref:Encoded protein n=1 Tax=Dunaliella salina TaxID=3046 RepID=A0ABQ7H9D5_DUNSA|nr:hypothetical protein DUNSADRAFT_15760 [Dunaliella salina]|eukprot:KAF5843465.1 hypothetical protein DUNSADRAFT_15760 [Dunaliella salina]